MILLFSGATLALLLVIIAASYFHFDTDYHFLQAKKQFLQNRLWLSTFYVHLASGIVAVLSGFPLFFEKIVKFRSKSHRVLGKIYVLSILILSGPTGFYLAFFTEDGPLASVGFILMSTIWMMITFIAVNYAVTENLQQHRVWMIRSYFFTLSGVTLRLYTPFGSSVLGLEYDLNFIISSFLPWIFNLCLAELVIFNVKEKMNLINA